MKRALSVVKGGILPFLKQSSVQAIETYKDGLKVAPEDVGLLESLKHVRPFAAWLYCTEALKIELRGFSFIRGDCLFCHFLFRLDPLFAFSFRYMLFRRLKKLDTYLLVLLQR